jgi:hypothetical protein
MHPALPIRIRFLTRIIHVWREPRGKPFREKAMGLWLEAVGKLSISRKCKETAASVWPASNMLNELHV